MNNSLKMGLAFVAGAITFNATAVFSNVPQSEELLTNALANAIYKVNQHQLKIEDEQLEKLPNILDCQNMQWMKNCTEINKQAKKNPNAPLRVENPKGVEFNFVPGTPSAVIRLQLEQTPEAAAAMVDYMDTTWGEYKKSSSLYQMELWKRGPMENIIGLDRAMELNEKPKAIRTEALSVSVFIHSQCGACEVQLRTLAKLREKYPSLPIKVFQVDQDASAFKRKVSDQGLNGRMLSSAEASQVHKSGVIKWPTIWIDNNQQKQRDTLSGTRSIVQIEERLQAMTYITTASK